MAASRVHDGYGQMLVTDLLPLHIDQWFNAHPSWGGGRRSRIQAVKRALNYSKEAGLIAANPIVGYSTPRATGRVTDRLRVSSSKKAVTFSGRVETWRA